MNVFLYDVLSIVKHKKQIITLLYEQVLDNSFSDLLIVLTTTIVPSKLSWLAFAETEIGELTSMTVNTELQEGAAILTLATSLGLLGNIFVVVSICRRRSLLKNNHYYLILQLAICDLLHLFFFASHIYSIFAAKSFINSRFLCKIWGPTQTIFYNALPNFLVLISAVRYRAIVQPLKPAVRRRTLRKLSSCVYVLAIIFVIPYALVLRYDKTSGCHEQWPMESLNIAYTLSLTTVQYFIPVAILTAIYFKICKKLIARNKWIYRLNVSYENRQENDRVITWFQSVKFRSTKTFVVSFTIVISFVICACPTQVAWVISATSSKEIAGYSYWFNALHLFGTTVIHPYVYGILDSKVFLPFKHCQRQTI